MDSVVQGLYVAFLGGVKATEMNYFENLVWIGYNTPISEIKIMFVFGLF